LIYIASQHPISTITINNDADDGRIYFIITNARTHNSNRGVIAVVSAVITFI